MCSPWLYVIFNDTNPSFPLYFSGSLQIFTGITVTTMNATGFLSHPFYFLFLKVSHSYIQGLVNNCFRKALLLPVYFMDSEDDQKMAEDLLSIEI